MTDYRENIEDQISDLLDDPLFREIGARFRRFNLFEAVGAVRNELRHSNFLAYLLSPSRPHALGTEFLEQLLRAVISKLPNKIRPVGILEIIVGDLDTAFVERERDNIDILIEIKALRLVVVIENKVGAAVAPGQLSGYKRTIREKYKDWPIYLCCLILMAQGRSTIATTMTMSHSAMARSSRY
jgi:PD-(D/E)XK nuclease superfamily protein